MPEIGLILGYGDGMTNFQSIYLRTQHIIALASRNHTSSALEMSRRQLDFDSSYQQMIEEKIYAVAEQLPRYGERIERKRTIPFAENERIYVRGSRPKRLRVSRITS